MDWKGWVVGIYVFGAVITAVVTGLALYSLGSVFGGDPILWRIIIGSIIAGLLWPIIIPIIVITGIINL